MPTRRGFLTTLGAWLATASLARALDAQQPTQGMNTGTANVPMDEGRYRLVRLPSRGTGPSMTDAQRDALEHTIHCQCGCTLDIFTCRTTDFSCQVSPPMHHDVMALVAGGYPAQDIINAFVNVYGERVLMEPTKRGFDLTAWVMPFVALGGGTALVVTLLRRWRRAAAEPAAVTALPVAATPDELSRLDQLVRHDDA